MCRRFDDAADRLTTDASGDPGARGCRYGLTVTTVNMPALKWPGMLQTKR